MPEPRSNFAFLRAEWPPVFEAAAKTESLANVDGRTACFYGRRALELAVHWLYKHDAALKLPYQEHLSALIHEPTFRDAVGPAVFAKARVLIELGNLAVQSHKPVRQLDAITATRELFHFCFWLARTYARGAKPADGLSFNPDLLPKTALVPHQTQEQLQRLEMQLRERDEKLASLLADKTTLGEELDRLRAEVAEAKKANAARPDEHNYSEAETRDYFIDLLLKEAGWALDQERDREFPVTGMPSESGEGFVDYVLWGDDGIPLALNEAKRTKRDPRVGQQQAKLYADCLEKQFGRRPIIFYSNGYDHWIWDDVNYPPRPVQGFYKKAELELLIQRRKTRKPLADAKINEAIVDRYYQTRGVRRIGEAFEIDRDRKTLVVQATGGGKTRMVIALSDLLMRCNWAMLNLQLAVLRVEPSFKRLSAQVKAIAGLLEEKSSIPMVREQMPLIQEIQTDEWWQDVTTPMLEIVRRRLRALVKLIEKQQRKPIYTDFEDELGGETTVELLPFTAPDSFERFRAKTRQFLREHEDDLVIHKLRMNEPLTATDLQELERMLTASGLASPDHLQKARTESNGLGLFVRSLVGLKREAAKQALAGFVAGKTLSANQIEFVNLIVDHLTEHGAMNPELLYESPFTDLTDQSAA